MVTLSVVVSVFNGEKYLSQCLTSVKDIADEIIVIDHESTDNSLVIAKKFTKKIYIQKNNPEDIDRQKNFGFEKASSDWILSLDADEKLTEELKKEISEGITDEKLSGYWIPRKNIIFGKWIEHTGWYPDYQLRLFKTGKGKYIKQHVHEDLHVDGPTAKFVSPFVHEAYQSIVQFLQRGLLIYAPNEAKAIKNNGYIFSFADAIRFPVKEFLSRFFAREGYKDGFYGLVLSLLMSYYHFTVFVYLWEIEKFKDNDDSLSVFAENIKKSQKEFQYWIETAHLEKEKNPASKIFLRAKRKLGL